MSDRRQRADGSWTFTTPEWDARWYWPMGTRVKMLGITGCVIKENNVTVRVRFDAGAERLISKLHPELNRL